MSLDEYIGKKKDGTINSQWATKPATMIKKVALVQALRDAFPSALGQLYIQDEMDIDTELPTNEVNVKEELKKANHVDPIKIPASKISHMLSIIIHISPPSPPFMTFLK